MKIKYAHLTIMQCLLFTLNVAVAMEVVDEDVYTQPGPQGTTWVIEKITSEERRKVWSDYTNALNKYRLQDTDAALGKAEDTLGLAFSLHYKNLMNHPEKRAHDPKLARLHRYLEIYRWAADPIQKMNKTLWSTKGYEGVSVWIAYLADSKLNCGASTKPSLRELLENVDIAISVVSHEHAPMVLHMGISRNIAKMCLNLAFECAPGIEGEEANYDFDKPIFKSDDIPNVAIQLHAFCAYALLHKFNQDKQFLATGALKFMFDMLAKAFTEQHVFFAHGEDFDKHFAMGDAKRELRVYDKNMECIFDSTLPGMGLQSFAWYRNCGSFFGGAKNILADYRAIAELFLRN